MSIRITLHSRRLCRCNVPGTRRNSLNFSLTDLTPTLDGDRITFDLTGFEHTPLFYGTLGVSVIPEPTAVSLLALGLLALRRRRAQRR